ncbi:MAG TPA: peptidoglycan-associated lipoprotein Pal [Steroidobacteraceae bacterium]|nr:peptidoglycan-associated lipoprotein Pal [Steroidobacteraceae bacterium]
MRVIQLVAVLLTTLALMGCPKKPEVKPDAGAGTTTPSGATTNAAPATPTQGSSDLERANAQLRALQQRGLIIYFDYDKSDIKPEFVGVLTENAKFLNANVGYKVRLEGHTDERGSREYNIGLGERRAQAVRRALLLQGVNESQITTISYGEERPAVDGHDEAAYAKNRRVEMSYSK